MWGGESACPSASVAPFDKPADRGCAMGAEAATARHLSVKSGKAGGMPQDDEDRLMRLLYDEHAQPLYRYVLKLVGGDSHRAEDVVQETLVRAWRNVSRIDADTRPLRPWLVTVARRIVIDDYRGRSSRPKEVDPAPLEFMAAADELDDAMSFMVISEALEDLKPSHREMLLEVYTNGTSTRELSDKLGISLSAVKSRLFYSLQALRLALAERGVIES